MTYTLITANRNYSSWSLRPWVLMKALNLPFEDRIEPFAVGVTPVAMLIPLHRQLHGQLET